MDATKPVDVFLTGSVGESQWQKFMAEELSKALNFVVTNRTEFTIDDYARNCECRTHAKYIVHGFSPLDTRPHLIAELISDAIHRPKTTLFFMLESEVDSTGNLKSMTSRQLESFEAVAQIAIEHGAKEYESVRALVDFLNDTVKH